MLQNEWEFWSFDTESKCWQKSGKWRPPMSHTIFVEQLPFLLPMQPWYINAKESFFIISISVLLSTYPYVCLFYFFGFEVPPIDQKRMVAFINEFIVSTVSFLNQFMTNCETKFVEFELKMQKIEASLLIVEAKVPNFILHPPRFVN